MSLPGQPTTYEYDSPRRETLQRFPNPMRKGAEWDGEITIVAPEFTSLCPLTGQPDFATIEVFYYPLDWCVESKSFKLYLGQYRMHKGFHEAVVQQICDDLVAVIEPRYLEVLGKFTPRGGIPFWPKVTYNKR